jgi:predicted NBD/HSP70 family sugar kinase
VYRLWYWIAVFSAEYGKNKERCNSMADNSPEDSVEKDLSLNPCNSSSVKRIEDEMTESKRTVITLLNRYGPQSKRTLAERGDLGWATIVKVVNQLSEQGIITSLGKDPVKPSGRGRDSLVYGLSRSYPLAIGIDVEYKRTRIVVTNIASEILFQDHFSTTKVRTSEGIKEFFKEIIEVFLNKYKVDKQLVVGAGIGIPGIGFSVHSQRQNLKYIKDLECYLENHFSFQVRIETNTKAYAVFEKWINDTFSYKDFIFVSVRTGVGTGIIYDGKLFTGSHGLAGEIGHMKVANNNRPCRCGGIGCMETVVNHQYLYRQYMENILNVKVDYQKEPDQADLVSGLADLFSRSKRGEKDAREITDRAAGYLGQCIANAIMALDITNIIVSGHFGPDGAVILEPLNEIVRKSILPETDFHITFCQFDPEGHTNGAALLILKKYFIDEFLRSNKTQ